ncbi:hypothetical protein BH10ACT11_BH10ACT11_22130 [soil metagenome]
MAKELSKPVSDAVARARRSGGEDEPRRRKSGGRSMDVFGGEIRRREVVPLLVLHLIAAERAYGNKLIEEIESITEGVISVNPNTIYPLLRDLEARKMIKGEWEHPDRRSRRFYSITAAGRKEYERMLAETEPFLDSVIRSVSLIKREIYGKG